MREIEFELSKANFRELYVATTLRRIWKFGLLVGLALTAFFAIDDFCGCQWPTVGQWLEDALWGFGFALVVCAAVVALNAQAANTIYSHKRKLGRTSKVSWGNESLKAASLYASAAYPWGVAEKWMETRNLVVVYLAGIYPLLIPKAELESGELEDLRLRLAAAKAGDKPQP